MECSLRRQILEELHDYVKNLHTTGLVWNAKGGDAKGKNRTVIGKLIII